MDFKTFSDYAEKVEDESKDTVIVDLVAELLEKCDDEALQVVPVFIQGRIFPKHIKKNVGIGQSRMQEAIAGVTDISEEEVENLLVDFGDLGEIFNEISIKNRSGQQTLTSSKNSVKDIQDTLEYIAGLSGAGSTQEKISTLKSLFRECSSVEAKFLTRLILEEMRIGVGEGMVRDAISQAFDVDVDLVERGLMYRTDAGEVATIAKEEGDDGLESLEIEVGRPIESMKAQSTTFEDMNADIDSDSIVVEAKYDGGRIQCHIGDDNVRLFTRNLEEVTSSLPDVVEILEETVTESNVILDSEVIAFDKENREVRDFTSLLRRLRRKHDIEEYKQEIELELRIFDILYREQKGGEMISNNLETRYQNLTEVVTDYLPLRTIVETVEEARRFNQKVLNKGHEGTMAKNPSSRYKPNKRGKEWLKLKPEVDTLDVVVIGGEYGEGRREDFIGTFEVAVWDNNELRSVGKVATGITDEKLEQLTERFEPLIKSKTGKAVDFSNQIVFEVGFEGTQESPTNDSGYGLRFPRFIQVREDKEAQDADTLERLKNIDNKK